MSALTLMLCLTTGCTSTGGFTPPWKKADTKLEVPKDSIALAGHGYELEPVDPKLREQLDAAKRLTLDKKYADAERIYHRLAAPGAEAGFLSNLNPLDFAGSADPALAPYAGKNRGKYPKTVFEEALFGAAECQRLQKNYRDAVDTYTKLLVQCQNTRHTAASCKGLFEIADYWLEPTRRQMDDYQEQLKGKKWLVMPASYLHFSKDMPWLDTEGNAITILNLIRLHDINGEMGKRALLYLGTINFFRKDYKEADFYFTQLYKDYPNSPDAAKAVKQSVICKQLMTGGTVYDLRGVDESKKLLMQAQAAFPEFADDAEWVSKQLISINYQQAERDFKIAEFYQRTGHPGSAYFYFELVCRRYPGTNFAAQALQRKEQLKSKVAPEQREQGSQPSVKDTPRQPTPRILPNLVPPPAGFGSQGSGVRNQGSGNRP
ncbi:MAG: tetratricopeptide repeat protein [Gemmataceae bacterium]|nr:tetratricopeptide repeat protein [Gemmataceae bacterium]